jgi:hypothetical protein
MKSEGFVQLTNLWPLRMIKGNVSSYTAYTHCVVTAVFGQRSGLSIFD